MRIRHVASAVAAAALFFATLVSAPASAATWNFETLDGNGPAGDPNGRTTSSTGLRNSTVVWSGQPHVWYHDDTSNDLRHAWWTGTEWRFETLDGDTDVGGRTTNEVGNFTTATVWNNEPHVWYVDNTSRDLRHAWFVPTARRWFYETLDGNCPTPTCADGRTASDVGLFGAATVYGGTPHVWYHDAFFGHLRHAWWNGTAWNYEVLDGDCEPGPTCANGRVSNDVGRFASVLTWNNEPHVWYRDATNGDLRHAWYVPGARRWFYETLDGKDAVEGRVNDDVGGHIAGAVWNNQPHVWYLHDGAVNDLRHAWWNGRSWSFESLDGNCPTSTCADGRTATDVGRHNVVGAWNGQLHVWYHDLGLGDLRHAWWDGTRWYFAKLDGHQVGPGGRINADLGYDGAFTVWGNQPHVWYHDATGGNLRHAWYG